MDSGLHAVPDDLEALKAALAAARIESTAAVAWAEHVEAELAAARAKASNDQALIAHQQLHIAKLTRQLYGQRSERTSRLVDQLALQFEELESTATADEIAAEKAVAKTTTVASFTRKPPGAQALPRSPAARAGDRAGTARRSARLPHRSTSSPGARPAPACWR